jgi:succinoglycan biosynthesis transport protein ExoP
MDQFNNSQRPPPSQGDVVPFRRQSLPTTTVETAPEPEQDQDGFSPRDFLAMLMRRMWIIIGVAVLVLAAVMINTLLQRPMYEATATVEVKRQETRIVEGGEVTPTVIADSDHMATQLALLRSRSLAEKVAESLDLVSDPRYATPSASPAERLDQATDVIVRGMQVSVVQRSRVISVQFRSPYPDEAARIATAIAETYIRSEIERRFNATAYARTFLEERLQTTKTALEEAERKLVAYSREKSIIDLSGTGGSATGSSLDASALVALNTALTDAQRERITAEQKFAQARDNPTTRSTLSNDAIETLNENRARLATEYQEKLRTFKPDFPEMRDLMARIDAIEQEIKREQDKIVAGMEAESRSAQAREKALTDRVNQLKGEVQDNQSRAIDYNILGREVDTLRSQYNALLQRFKEVSIVSGISESQVALVDKAEPPDEPYSPNLRNAILIGIFLALGLGIGLAMLIDYVDDTIKAPEDVKLKLGLPTIGVVPKVGSGEEILESLLDPRSSASEAFGSARAALQFTTPVGPPRSLLITGNRPSEGKTSSVTGLAMAFAGVGRRVLVIDADMRRPSFAADASSSIGLSGLLTQNRSILGEIVQGKTAGVHLLPAGVTPPNPSELLSSPRIGQIIAEAVDNFDIVLVDAPPVLDFADAPLLSSVCDGTLMVVQAGAIRRPAARRTMERLLASNANILGVLLTKFDIKRTGYSYGYSYGYGYRGYRSDAADTASREALAKRRVRLFSPETQGANADPRP